MATLKRKKTHKKKTTNTEILVKTEVSALAALALFLATIPLAIMIALWTSIFAIMIVKY